MTSPSDPPAQSSTSEQLHDPHPQADEHAHVHPLPISKLMAVFLGLLFLTWLTVFASGLEGMLGMSLGGWSVAIALLIAVVKGSLVVLYFMHLRYESPFNALVLCAALLFVALFISSVLMDATAYQPNMTPPQGIEAEG